MGAPPGGFGMMPAGGPMGGFGGGALDPSMKPKIRNPVMTIALPYGLMVGGNIIGSILGSIEPMLAMVGSLFSLAGLVIFLVYTFGMLGELKRVTQNQGFQPWFILIPCFNYYFMWIKVPEEVTRAKQIARSQVPTRSIVVYVFLFLYALAADLNDVAQSQ